jgi:integrase
MDLLTYSKASYEPHMAALAPSTRLGYECDLKNLVYPRWGGVELSEIKASAIEEWLSGMTHGQAVNALGGLRRIMRKAERDDLITIDPCRKTIQLPKRRKAYRPRWLETAEVRELAVGFWGHPLEAWLTVSLMCGLRRCESTALYWSDIDLREGGIEISKGLQCTDGKLVEWFAKTPNSVRTVYLPKNAVRRLREIKENGALVPDGDGSRMNPDKVARHYRSWCRKASLPFVPPMYLRHTYVHMAIEAGIPEAVIKEQLGHTESSAMLREHYFWSGKKVSKDAASKINAILLE